MKNLNLYSAVLVIFIFSSNVNVDDITDRLDSPEYYVRYMAAGEIIENHLVQYIPALAERALNQPFLYLSYRYLEGLYELGYSNINQYTHDFIGICDSFPKEGPLYYKCKATSILVELGDYSTVGYAFEFVNADPLENAQRIIPLLYCIGEKLPAYSDTVKNLLVMIKDNSTSPISRRFAFYDLLKLYGESNLRNEILTSVTDDVNPDIRHEAMSHYNFPDRKDVLKQRIRNESNSTLRGMYAEIFLKENDKPEDLQFMIDYNKREPDENIRETITNIILGFAPKRPDETVSPLEMINNLLSVTDDLYSYHWIKSEALYNSYKNTLEAAAEDIGRGLTGKASDAVYDMLDRVESDYHNTSSVSFEAWQFLHYHLEYILDKLLCR